VHCFCLAGCPTAHPVQNSRSSRTRLCRLPFRCTSRLSVPWTCTETAKRALCVVAPNVWNSLLNDTTPVRCQRFVPNWNHFFYCCILVMNIEHTHLCTSVLTSSWLYRHNINLFYVILLILSVVPLHQHETQDAAITAAAGWCSQPSVELCLCVSQSDADETIWLWQFTHQASRLCAKEYLQTRAVLCRTWDFTCIHT